MIMAVLDTCLCIDVGGGQEVGHMFVHGWAFSLLLVVHLHWGF